MNLVQTGSRFFVAYWYFNGASVLNFGLTVSLTDPSLEVHLPFGFARVGWQKSFVQGEVKQGRLKYRAFGWNAESRIEGLCPPDEA